MSPDPDPTGLLPLTPVAFEILLAVGEGPRHGYAIMKDIEGRTHGRLSLHPGTLYRAIGRLVDEGMLEEREAPQGRAVDTRRRTYAITPFGRRVAAAEAARLERQLGAARSRRLTDRPRPA